MLKGSSMARLFVWGVRGIGAALVTLVAMGPGCTNPSDDVDQGSGGSETGGAAGSGAGFSVGGSGGDLIFDGDCEEWCGGQGGASGGTPSFGGEGGLGGASGGGPGIEAEHLGEFSAGDSLPWLPSIEELPAGESVVYGITFLDAVWFGGELTTTGDGTPELTLLDAEGDHLVAFTGAWEDYLLPAGDYFLGIAPDGHTSLDQGYDLDMMTRIPFSAGTVTAASSSSTSAVFDFAGQFQVHKFIAATPIVLTGTLTHTSGNVDIYVYDKSASIVASYQSPDPMETLAPLELPVGTYMIQVVGVTSTADFLVLFEWDDP